MLNTIHQILLLVGIIDPIDQVLVCSQALESFLEGTGLQQGDNHVDRQGIPPYQVEHGMFPQVLLKAFFREFLVLVFRVTLAQIGRLFSLFLIGELQGILVEVHDLLPGEHFIVEAQVNDLLESSIDDLMLLEGLEELLCEVVYPIDKVA